MHMRKSVHGLLPRADRLPLATLIVAICLAGCGAPAAKFHSNLVFVHRKERESKTEFTPQQLTDVTNILTGLFGTPDEPHLPATGELDTSKLIDIDRVKMSAGAVASDKHGQPAGLYREHCVHCHGITGDGMGPTAAFLNPYPRDYRKGIFKFKSTEKGQRPTHDDLKRIVLEGVAGTAMPSFKVLDMDEVESLVHYVKFLAIRGEVERRLADEVVELEENERLIINPSEKDKDAAKFQEKLDKVRGIVNDVMQAWIDAETQAVQIAGRPAGWELDRDALKKSQARGRELFYGTIANCSKCHGDSALGDGVLNDFDDWTKELDPADPTAVKEYQSLGALSPRNIRPRNLRMGIFRGGRRPIDIYWRIANGIDGTPMPAVPKKPANEKGLDPDDIWALVDYVLSLPYETTSPRDAYQPTVVRERL